MKDAKSPLLPLQREYEIHPAPGRGNPPGMEWWGLKKKGQWERSWIRIDNKGTVQVLDVDKVTIMRMCNLPARDLRLLDPLFVYPATILGREKAIVVNLEQIRCIIMAEEVLVLNAVDNYVLQYVSELQRRLFDMQGLEWSTPGAWKSANEGSGRKERDFAGTNQNDKFDDYSSNYLPFEFKALEVALEAACTFLNTQLKDYIEHTEELINIQLDNVRNQLIQFELLLTCATLVISIFAVVAGIFGMNIQIAIFRYPWAFKWVLIISGVVGLSIFLVFWLFFRWRGLMSF